MRLAQEQPFWTLDPSLEVEEGGRKQDIAMIRCACVYELRLTCGVRELVH